MRLDVFKKLCNRNHRSQKLEKANSVPGITGHFLHVLGKTQVDVDRAGSITVLVVRDMNHEIILGDDALRKGKALLDYDNNIITWFSAKWPLSRVK